MLAWLMFTRAVRSRFARQARAGAFVEIHGSDSRAGASLSQCLGLGVNISLKPAAKLALRAGIFGVWTLGAAANAFHACVSRASSCKLISSF
jgi:hypothetical protein